MEQKKLVNESRLLSQKLLSGGVWAFLGKASNAVLALIINGMIARMLNPSDAGLYFLGFNIALFGAYFGLLGLEQTSTRFIAEGVGNKRYNQIVSVIKRTSFIVSIGTLVVGGGYYVIATFLFGALFPSSNMASLTVFISIWIAGNVFHLLLAEYFRGLHDIRLASIFGGFFYNSTLICSLFVFGFVTADSMTIVHAINLTIGSLIFSSLIGWLLLFNKLRFYQKQKEAYVSNVSNRKLYQTAWPILGVTLSLFLLSQSDLWIVGLVANEETIALYGAALRLTAIVSMPIIVLNAVVAPFIAAKNGQGKMKDLESILRLMGGIALLPALALVILFSIFPGQVMSLLFGPFYGGAALFLILLSLKQLVIVWNGACGILMLMADKQRQLMKITVSTGILALCLTTGLGLLFGGIGVAIGSLIANVICQICMWAVVRASMNIRVDASLKAVYKLVLKYNSRFVQRLGKTNER
ncbi:lipopolysaccharide biosynthesis protein [Alkalicoccobacillus porphyridii]|uniref:Oligosaccharide flippase family protein n=1 Tax=Alkalicoccobacillus porphyridii TaxID=2597270 RepID=A0A554A464_9BACI|nr:oligosaccharide flippase family protein [Alkalicoccobacillus porphyridii]TSB48477.1 oligosaccharide flippase family protein [Alkalicoccobacillus porphyridii]